MSSTGNVAWGAKNVSAIVVAAMALAAPAMATGADARLFSGLSAPLIA
jgi:hypothetical protein